MRLGRLVAILACSLALPALIRPARAEGPRVPIANLNAQTWAMAQGLVPDEYLERYKKGEWALDIFDFEPSAQTSLVDHDFIAAGRQNAGRYVLTAEGGIVEAATGKQPAFIYGPPFPDIDPADTQAGAKIVWNFFYQSYLLGNSHNFLNFDWVGDGGPERHLALQVYQRFFDGQPAKYRPAANPQNFLFQQLVSVSSPADLQGMLSLTHRFRDADKRDQVWTYVPALRRVRSVSPVNRSDGFLGSDISQDDGSFFDGKPEEFTWRLVGEAENLVMYDRRSFVDREQHLRQLPGGGDESLDSTRPRLNYQLPNWKGLPWAPLPSESILTRRRVWVVEGVPKDKYYLFGKIVLRFDKESWRGSYNSKYDWKGNLLNSYVSSNGPYFRLGDEWRIHGESFFTMNQNFKMNRATVGYMDPAHPQNQARLPLPDNLFNVDALARAGK